MVKCLIQRKSIPFLFRLSENILNCILMFCGEPAHFILSFQNSIEKIVVTDLERTE